MQLVQIARDPNSDNINKCQKVLDTDTDLVLFQGRLVNDPEVLSRTMPGSDERVVALSREVVLQAARQLLGVA